VLVLVLVRDLVRVLGEAVLVFVRRKTPRLPAPTPAPYVTVIEGMTT